MYPKRLTMMGLLSKYPARSSVLQRFGMKGRFTRNYTKYEKMHMVAAWTTPEISKEWIITQLMLHCDLTRKQVEGRLRAIVADPENKRRWKKVGERNLMFIREEHVVRYFNRNVLQSVKIPSWAVPYIRDDIKRGMTHVEVAKKYNISKYSVTSVLKRNIFDGPKPGRGLSPYEIKGGKS